MDISAGKSTEGVVDALFCQIESLGKDLVSDDAALTWFHLSSPALSAPLTPPTTVLRPTALAGTFIELISFFHLYNDFIILGLISPPESCSNSPSVPVTSLTALNLASFARSPTLKPINLPADEVKQLEQPDGSSSSGSMPRSRSCSTTSSLSSCPSDPPELVAKVTAMLDAGMITPLGKGEEKKADVSVQEEGDVDMSEKEEEKAVSSVQHDGETDVSERKEDKGKVSMQEEGEMEVSEEQEAKGDSLVQKQGEAEVAEKQGEEDVSMQEEEEVDASEEEEGVDASEEEGGVVDASEEEGGVDASEKEEEGDSSYEEEDRESSIIADNKSVAGSVEHGEGEPMAGVESNGLPPDSSDNQAADAMDIDPVEPKPPRRSPRNASSTDKVYTESVAPAKQTKTKMNPKVRSQLKLTTRLLLDVSLQIFDSRKN